MSMKEVCCPYFDPEFENLNERIYGPRVYVDNDSCEKCTVVKVDSLNKQGLLLEVVQVLTDMDLFISKSYISFDAGWLMDVFHVKDQQGNKVTDNGVINYLQQSIVTRRELKSSGDPKACTEDAVEVEPESTSECTAIEMIGTNRPGIFSEISAVLAEQKCNIIEAHAWSHNACVACVAYVSDESTSTCIHDPSRLATIEDHLSTVLRPTTITDDEFKGAKTRFLGCDSSTSHKEHRLHQLMLANRDFDESPGSARASFSSMGSNGDEDGRRTTVSIDPFNEKGYSCVNVECPDRPKLMFDIVCTLTDLQYVIFHASITSHGLFAYQEYYIRHKDGFILNSEQEKQRVAKCLEAAIERRVCEGVRLELCAKTSVGLLPYVTRILREYGLTVTRADIATDGGKTKNVFYVQDISGNEVDMDILESMQKELEPLAFQVKNEVLRRTTSMEKESFSFGSLLKSQLEWFSHNYIRD
ncbi:ACT domain-containing protein ACR2 isoform X2 [Dioscorea cayenensis subsp. rotundata]|uniref:ACT domain-containing protein ACR n=1 Tax=Dioscorea cayennensis subsp. rotundata TaxID=55577 RepID=A0AB40CSS1_DIOCR|nr:ACT domain-containing protein ACR2 isoform X2 [Dioscorea cayenensis subsp. rotundata]